MNEENNTAKQKPKEQKFTEIIEEKVARKIKAERKKQQTLLHGFGVMGIIGWSVIIPTLLGVALGIFLDNYFPTIHSWTLLLLILGLFIGCLNAWYFLAKERKEIEKEEKNSVQ